MKETQMSLVHAVNLVENSGNITYSMENIENWKYNVEDIICTIWIHFCHRALFWYERNCSNTRTPLIRWSWVMVRQHILKQSQSYDEKSITLGFDFSLSHMPGAHFANIFYLRKKLAEIIFSCVSVLSNLIIPQFCTCHGSTAAMACAKFRSDHSLVIYIKA